MIGNSYHRHHKIVPVIIGVELTIEAKLNDVRYYFEALGLFVPRVLLRKWGKFGENYIRGGNN